MNTSFYSAKELARLGLKSYGCDVLLSRKASIYGPERIELGNHVRIDDFCILSGSISLGSYIHVGAYSAFFGSEGIVMGDYTGISARVTIFTVSENFLGNGMTNPMIPDRYRHPVQGKVNIEQHAVIGSSTVILPGVTIGTGAAIGAMSLVKEDCMPWTVYVGSPVKAKKERQRDIIQGYQAEIEELEKWRRASDD